MKHQILKIDIRKTGEIKIQINQEIIKTIRIKMQIDEQEATLVKADALFVKDHILRLSVFFQKLTKRKLLSKKVPA